MSIRRSRFGGGIAGLVAIVVVAGCGGANQSTSTPRASAIPTAVRGARPAAVRTTALRVRTECRQAARRAGSPIACPTGLPPGSTPFWANGFGGGSDCTAVTNGRPLLPRWTWVGTYFRHLGHTDHLIVASVPRVVAPRSFVYLIGTAVPHRSRSVVIAGTLLVDGHRARVVHPLLTRTAGVGISMGQTVVIWTQGGRTYAIGVAGRGIHAQATEIALARRLAFVTFNRGSR
jgi:hypothetical protein